MDKIEIPFGAYDSETLGWTYTIPKGYTAKIEDGKIIVKKEELEDERIRKEIIDFIQWAEDRGMTRHDYYQAKRPAVWIAYLKKQKEQNQEWSEEDSAILDCAVEVVEKAGLPSLAASLKSLRPRPHWKPSEEQMEALRSAVNKLAKTDVADSVRLSIMYDNLKKLM